MAEKPSLAIHYDDEGEWAALYVDGDLVTVGDAYVAEERAFALAGVETVHDSAFMRGQDQRAGVAQTLAEVAEYVRDRDARAERAAELRRQASALEAEATLLERP